MKWKYCPHSIAAIIIVFYPFRPANRSFLNFFCFLLTFFIKTTHIYIFLVSVYWCGCEVGNLFISWLKVVTNLNGKKSNNILSLNMYCVLSREFFRYSYFFLFFFTQRKENWKKNPCKLCGEVWKISHRYWFMIN